MLIMKTCEFMVWSFSTTKRLHKFKLRWLLHNFTAPGNSSEPPCIMYSSWNCQLHAARNWQASPLCNHLAPSNVQANLQSPNDNVVASHQDVNSMQWRHLRLHDLTDSRTGRLLLPAAAAGSSLLIARSCPMCRPVCMYFCELLNFTYSNYLCSTLRTRGMTTRTSVSWELHAIRGQRKEIPAWRTGTCCEKAIKSIRENILTAR